MVRVQVFTNDSGERTAMLSLKGRRRGICREEYEYLLVPNLAEHGNSKLLWSAVRGSCGVETPH